VVNPSELVELRAAAARMGFDLDEEQLADEELNPDGFAAATVKLDRAAREEFLSAALRIALADGDLHLAEIDLLRRFARALGCDRISVRGWELVGRDD
jgi:uncharacterized tellurite resistance protein B-like protein